MEYSGMQDPPCEKRQSLHNFSLERPVSRRWAGEGHRDRIGPAARHGGPVGRAFRQVSEHRQRVGGAQADAQAGGRRAWAKLPSGFVPTFSNPV
jgi:hypothetical protein